jgi:hypothetical protein
MEDYWVSDIIHKVLQRASLNEWVLVEPIECLPHTHPRMEIGPISKMLFNLEYWPIEKFQKELAITNILYYENEYSTCW